MDSLFPQGCYIIVLIIHVTMVTSLTIQGPAGLYVYLPLEFGARTSAELPC